MHNGINQAPWEPDTVLSTTYIYEYAYIKHGGYYDVVSDPSFIIMNYIIKSYIVRLSWRTTRYMDYNIQPLKRNTAV